MCAIYSQSITKLYLLYRPLRKWISNKKDAMNNISPSYGIIQKPTPLKDKTLDEKEKDRKLKKQRRDKEAEEFKKKHLLLNPLRSNKESEETLKSLLGMNGRFYLD